jgi:hypothetical protein
MDINELLNTARRPEAEITLSLRGDLQSQWEDLDVSLRSMQAVSVTLSPSPETIAVAEQIKALEEQMKSSQLTLRLRAASRKEWMTLLSRHTPRPDVPSDKILGVNAETFFDDLLSITIVDPVFTADQMETLLDSVTSNQYDKLTDTAWNLNRADKDGPVFSRAASQVIPASVGTSERPSDSGSVPPALRGKSPRKSPRTNTTKTDG